MAAKDIASYGHSACLPYNQHQPSKSERGQSGTAEMASPRSKTSTMDRT